MWGVTPLERVPPSSQTPDVHASMHARTHLHQRQVEVRAVLVHQPVDLPVEARSGNACSRKKLSREYAHTRTHARMHVWGEARGAGSAYEVRARPAQGEARPDQARRGARGEAQLSSLERHVVFWCELRWSPPIPPYPPQPPTTHPNLPTPPSPPPTPGGRGGARQRGRMHGWEQPGASRLCTWCR